MTDPSTLKNDTQRKEWLANYRDWGIWYRDDNIGATYYRYDFPDGATMIVDEYFEPGNEYYPAKERGYHHLFGGPKPTKPGSWWTWHDWYERYPDSDTYLVNFLKATKGGTV